MCRRPGQKGARRASARPFARRLHHENPRKIGRLRRHHRLRSDRRRTSDGRHFETLLDIGPDVQPRAVISRQRLRQQGQPRGRKGARHRAGHPAQGQRKRQAGLLRATLYKARARIEQGVGRLKRFKRVALRCEKTERNFRSIVTSPQASLDQIRPHRLVYMAHCVFSSHC